MMPDYERMYPGESLEKYCRWIKKEGVVFLDTETAQQDARKKKVAEWRTRPEYREKSDAFLKKNPWCEVWLEVGVKVPATEIHHPNKWSYASFELYVDFENNGAMAVSGSHKKPGGGHYACHNGLKVCPICKKKKCNQHAEGCQSCLKKKYPKLAAQLELVKRAAMDRKNVKQKELRDNQKTKVQAWKQDHKRAKA